MNIATTACPWWIRWWHRRKRIADVRFMLPAIRQAAAVHAPDDPQAVDKAWIVFVYSPGQEHWHCPCARMEK